MFKIKKIFIFIINIILIKESIVGEEEIENNELIPIPMIHDSFKNLFNFEYKIANKYKIGICMIGKNFSSVMVRIFCSLENNSKRHYGIEKCKKKEYFNSLTELEKFHKIGGIKKLFKKYKMLMIIRNPIDRLISGFMQLCYFRTYLTDDEDYCYGCNKNLTCFINNLHTSLWNIVNKKSFPDRVHSYHYYPQTWQCDYYKYKNYYTYANYSNSNINAFYDEILKHLAAANVPNYHINYLDEKLHSKLTPHGTIDKNETNDYKDYLYKNQDLLQKACEIFYYDYIEFGFDLPDSCLQMKKISNGL
uniref:Sulfotransfer_1 domain-containing protein n=1 Tax=Strongyloides stercoralis TaxID=6248 RepID=A0A0K0E2F8_STRER